MASHLVDLFRSYLYHFNTADALSNDLKMLVGTVIIEYLNPLVCEDQYLMEYLVVVGPSSVLLMGDIAMDTIEIAMESKELTKFV